MNHEPFKYVVGDVVEIVHRDPSYYYHTPGLKVRYTKGDRGIVVSQAAYLFEIVNVMMLDCNMISISTTYIRRLRQND